MLQTEDSDRDLSFDHYQFEKNDGNRAALRAALDYAEFSDSCSRTTGFKPDIGNGRWIPPFANNDAQLRRVLIFTAQQFLKASFGNHTVTDDWKKLDEACTDAALARAADADLPEHQKTIVNVFRNSVQHAGSYMALLASISFHRWRRGLSCVQVAALLDITPGQVRQKIHGLVKNARLLGFETFLPHKTAGHKKDKKTLRHFNEARRRAIRRRLYGNPDYIEGVHCWECRVEKIAPGQKWRCAKCAAWQRVYYKRKRNRDIRAHAIHSRWHTRKGKRNPACRFCQRSK